jgi:hypothetical protein
MVEKIENFEMNSMPPVLELAEIHRDCNKIGQALDYRLVRSVRSSPQRFILTHFSEKRHENLPVLL